MKRYVADCYPCSVSISRNDPPPVTSRPLPEGPWKEVLVDFKGPVGGKNGFYYHVVIDNYLEFGKTHKWLFSHNDRLWSHCISAGQKQMKSSYCWTPEFLNKFCPLFPFQSIKTVRSEKLGFRCWTEIN